MWVKTSVWIISFLRKNLKKERRDASSRFIEAADILHTSVRWTIHARMSSAETLDMSLSHLFSRRHKSNDSISRR